MCLPLNKQGTARERRDTEQQVSLLWDIYQFVCATQATLCNLMHVQGKGLSKPPLSSHPKEVTDARKPNGFGYIMDIINDQRLK